MGLLKIRDTLFGGPYDKDSNILGSILRSPILEITNSNLGSVVSVWLELKRKEPLENPQPKTLNPKP